MYVGMNIYIYIDIYIYIYVYIYIYIYMLDDMANKNHNTGEIGSQDWRDRPSGNHQIGTPALGYKLRH